MDVRARHRELGRAEVEEGMAERVDAVAVDVRDRAGGAHLEIAADQGDANRVAFAERPACMFVSDGACAGGAAARHHRGEPGLAERTRQQVNRLRLEAAHHERRGDRPQHRAELRAGGGGQPDRLHVRRRLANGASRA